MTLLTSLELKLQRGLPVSTQRSTLLTAPCTVKKLLNFTQRVQRPSAALGSPAETQQDESGPDPGEAQPSQDLHDHTAD